MDLNDEDLNDTMHLLFGYGDIEDNHKNSDDVLSILNEMDKSRFMVRIWMQKLKKTLQ